MEIAKVKCSGTHCTLARVKEIPCGIVSATVSIEYIDPVWDSLQKTVVFRGTVTKDVLAAGNEVVIPAEVVSESGDSLYMGIYGVDADGTVIIPTVWVELGSIRDAAAPSGDSSTAPSLPVWAQIQGMIGDLDKLDTAAKSSLVAAVNEALLSGCGTVSPAAVQKIVDDYLKANPPADGKDGADGVTPNIQIGTVTTLPAGSDATASMSGTKENPLLNLGIPKGEAGQGGGSGGESWELIKAITIPEGAEETNALTISTDENGNAFALKKARLFSIFPKYTGESTIPKFSFTMMNGISSGLQSPLCYTSGWVMPRTDYDTKGMIDVDLTMPEFQVEQINRWTGTGFFQPSVVYFGERRMNGADAITSIGGAGMLIYPSCKFWLYGVRA